mmetsp:Transcript_23403/g.23598  ORF Transcript_23403/g.23598 Transcript_23403/m.23598 type:complete len:123 (+) Transcript_23403:1778-2146(+)
MLKLVRSYESHSAKRSTPTTAINKKMEKNEVPEVTSNATDEDAAATTGLRFVLTLTTEKSVDFSMSMESLVSSLRLPEEGSFAQRVVTSEHTNDTFNEVYEDTRQGHKAEDPTPKRLQLGVA